MKNASSALALVLFLFSINSFAQQIPANDEAETSDILVQCYDQIEALFEFSTPLSLQVVGDEIAQPTKCKKEVNDYSKQGQTAQQKAEAYLKLNACAQKHSAKYSAFNTAVLKLRQFCSTLTQ